MVSQPFELGRAARLLPGLAVLALAACDQSPTASTETLDAPPPSFAADGTVELGEFEVCKTYVGATGPAVTVNWTVDLERDGLGDVDDSGSVTLNDGECAIVHTYMQSGSSNGTEIQRVTVTEVVPSGYTASFIKTKLNPPNTTTDPETSGNSTSGDMLSNPDNGFLVEFINTEIPTGGEGCTPGYWRQQQHFDSYPTGFSPTTPFIGGTTGFTYDPALAKPESGFASDLTLLDALTLKGGDQNSLIRHAAAA